MEMFAVFKLKKSIPLSREKQEYIYAVSRLYQELPAERQKTVMNLCLLAGGGDYYRALFEFVTTDAGATGICMKHNLSVPTLYRIVRTYYMEFWERYGAE